MAEYTSALTEVFVDKTDSGTFTKITQVRTIEHGDRSVSVVEFSDLDAVALRRRPGLPDPGTLSIELNFDPADATHKWLEDQVGGPDVLPFKLSFSQTDPAQLRTFDGFITEFTSGGGENQDALSATVTVQIAGAVTASVATP